MIRSPACWPSARPVEARAVSRLLIHFDRTIDGSPFPVPPLRRTTPTPVRPFLLYRPGKPAPSVRLCGLDRFPGECRLRRLEGRPSGKKKPPGGRRVSLPPGGPRFGEPPGSSRRNGLLVTQL